MSTPETHQPAFSAVFSICPVCGGAAINGECPREVRLENEALKAELAALRAPRLARNQPCGCVICICEDPVRCHGCGAKDCGTQECVLRQRLFARVFEDAPVNGGKAEDAARLRAALEDAETSLGLRVKFAFLEGYDAAYAQTNYERDERWEQSDARQALAPTQPEENKAV